MTAAELISILKTMPPDNEVVLAIQVTDYDGHANTTIAHTGAFDTEEPQHEVTEGLCALRAGYPENFKTPQELEEWVVKYHSNKRDWVPASKLVLKINEL